MTKAELEARIINVNNVGIANLADKGVTVPAGSTTATIMENIANISQGGGSGITATVMDVQLISGVLPQISATVTEE